MKSVCARRIPERKVSLKVTYNIPDIPRLVPEPVYTEHTETPVLCLDGVWKVRHCADPDERADADCADWPDIPVPSSMSAYRKKTLAEGETYTGTYIYQRKVTLPDSFTGKRLVLKFEGVNGFARVYVNGSFVMRHENGFVTWNRDITEYVGNQKEFRLAVTVDERADKVSTFSQNGILHSVYLYALPDQYISSLRMTTTYDKAYENAVLRVDYTIGPERADKEGLEGLTLQITVTDPDGSAVREVVQPLKEECGFLEMDFEKPVSWDAEHPYLYEVHASLWKDGIRRTETKKSFGFRQIERRKNRLFVNGREVKLRGSCRHEISPLNGRCLTKELIDEDVKLFKEANCNYIRTSHYPPSEYFLDACDRAGIYVEDELALAFIARTLDYTQQDPAQTERYLSHFAEVFARDSSHPSVLIWSLCNESFGGYNFDLLNRFAHRLDPTRPTKFSYPMTMREEHEPVDIWSIHYSELDMDLAQKRDNVSVGGSFGKDMPVIHDEYVHVPCYNRTELRRDPNVRSFWGESIRRFWDKIWNTEGALGGAIWAGIDETDIFLGGNTHLEWGIIDIWRRRKPEHYATRKAYSPIVIPAKEIRITGEGARIPVENRFCHTSLAECRIDWSCQGQSGSLYGPEVEPFGRGELVIPGISRMDPQERLCLKWFDAMGNQVDEYELAPAGAGPVRTVWGEETGLPEKFSEGGPEKDTAREMDSGKRESEKLSLEDMSCREREDEGKEEVLEIREEGDLILSGSSFRLCFDEETGLLKEGSCCGEVLLTGGPVMNVPYLTLEPWEKKEFSWKRIRTGNADAAVIIISGSYGAVMDVTFTLTVTPDGVIHTAYRIDRLKKPLPKQVKLRVGVDCGGLDELGVAFLAAPGMDRLAWERDGAWTCYPEDHIARNRGIACRRSAGSEFGVRPEIAWKDEMKDYILNGRYEVDYKGTADFRSMKTEIYSAALYKEGAKACVAAMSDGRDSVRVQVVEPENYLVSDRDPRIRYSGLWYPMEDYGGSRDHTETWSREKGACAELSFSGTGIVWYGPVDTIYGCAKVYIDGILRDGSINQRVDGVDFPGSAAGYDKKYTYPVFSIDGLPAGEHTLRIEVTGEKARDAFDSYVVIDYFRILDGTSPEPAAFIVNNEYNYPHIAWGNYTKPEIVIYDGYENAVTVGLKERKNI